MENFLNLWKTFGATINIRAAVAAFLSTPAATPSWSGNPISQPRCKLAGFAVSTPRNVQTGLPLSPSETAQCGARPPGWERPRLQPGLRSRLVYHSLSPVSCQSTFDIATPAEECSSSTFGRRGWPDLPATLAAYTRQPFAGFTVASSPLPLVVVNHHIPYGPLNGSRGGHKTPHGSAGFPRFCSSILASNTPGWVARRSRCRSGQSAAWDCISSVADAAVTSHHGQVCGSVLKSSSCGVPNPIHPPFQR